MTKRLTLTTTLAVPLALGIAACGGEGSSGPTPLPTASTPPIQAAATLKVDPDPIVATHAGNDRHHHAGTDLYGFRAKLAFSESAGIGYTVDTVRAMVSSISDGRVLLNDVQTVNRAVPANGRRVWPYTSPLYLTMGETIGLTCDFTGTITDDRGRATSVSTRVEMTHRERF